MEGKKRLPYPSGVESSETKKFSMLGPHANHHKRPDRLKTGGGEKFFFFFIFSSALFYSRHQPKIICGCHPCQSISRNRDRRRIATGTCKTIVVLSVCDWNNCQGSVSSKGSINWFAVFCNGKRKMTCMTPGALSALFRSRACPELSTLWLHHRALVVLRERIYGEGLLCRHTDHRQCLWTSIKMSQVWGRARRASSTVVVKATRFGFVRRI